MYRQLRRLSFLAPPLNPLPPGEGRKFLSPQGRGIIFLPREGRGFG